MRAKARVYRTSLMRPQQQQQQVASTPAPEFVLVEYSGVDGSFGGSYPVDDVDTAPTVGDHILVTIEPAVDLERRIGA